RRGTRNERGMVIGKLVQQVAALQVKQVIRAGHLALVRQAGPQQAITCGAFLVICGTILAQDLRVLQEAAPLSPAQIRTRSDACRRYARQVAPAIAQLAAYIVTEY